MGLGKDKKELVCVKVYFNRKAWPAVTNLAVESKCRRVGLKLFTQKKNGFSGQEVANTDGVARFLKYAAKYYEADRANRTARTATLLKERQAIDNQLAEARVIAPELLAGNPGPAAQGGQMEKQKGGWGSG